MLTHSGASARLRSRRTPHAHAQRSSPPTPPRMRTDALGGWGIALKDRRKYFLKTLVSLQFPTRCRSTDTGTISPPIPHPAQGSRRRLDTFYHFRHFKQAAAAPADGNSGAFPTPRAGDRQLPGHCLAQSSLYVGMLRFSLLPGWLPWQLRQWARLGFQRWNPSPASTDGIFHEGAAGSRGNAAGAGAPRSSPLRSGQPASGRKVKET